MNYLKNGIVYLLLLLYLIKGSEKLKEYFFDNNLISKCIDFILGEKSPLFKEDNRYEKY